MTHPDHDTLLRFVLETLDAPDSGNVQAHVTACPECQHHRQALEEEIGRIASIGFDIQPGPPPRLPSRVGPRSWWIRSAAVLAIGFLLGYLVGGRSGGTQTILVQQHLRPTPVALSLTGFSPCAQVDLRVSGQR